MTTPETFWGWLKGEIKLILENQCSCEEFVIGDSANESAIYVSQRLWREFIRYCHFIYLHWQKNHSPYVSN